MMKGTLKKSEVTPTLEIIPVETQNSPNLNRYMKVVDEVFRNDGTDILGAAGFVCYLAFDRSRIKDKEQSAHHWFRGRDVYFDMLPGLQPSRLQAEELLGKHYQGRLWLTHLKGVRHDYYFYSRVDSVEHTLDLMEVAKVMAS